MFIYAIILSIIIGYLLGGKLSNLQFLKIDYVYLVLIAFIIEFGIVMSIQNNIIVRGILTYILDIIMYILIFTFIYLNRENKFILWMGIGFLLNAIAIFLNGGAMPVSKWAMEIADMSNNVEKEGLYILINENTRLWFLGDVIPFKLWRKFVISIGDIISAISMMLLIIWGMKLKRKNEIYLSK